MVLTYHPFNETIKRILLRNFNILSSDPETRAVFPQPPLVAYRHDSNLRDILVYTSDSSQSSFQAGTSPSLHVEGDRGGGSPEEQGAGGVRETGEERAGSRISMMVGNGEKFQKESYR